MVAADHGLARRIQLRIASLLRVAVPMSVVAAHLRRIVRWSTSSGHRVRDYAGHVENSVSRGLEVVAPHRLPVVLLTIGILRM